MNQERAAQLPQEAKEDSDIRTPISEELFEELRWCECSTCGFEHVTPFYPVCCPGAQAATGGLYVVGEKNIPLLSL